MKFKKKSNGSKFIGKCYKHLKYKRVLNKGKVKPVLPKRGNMNMVPTFLCPALLTVFNVVTLKIRQSVVCCVAYHILGFSIPNSNRLVY